MEITSSFIFSNFQMEEFKDFKKFIEKIEREDNAHLAGIVKIVPPKEWVPRKAGYDIETFGDLMIESPNKQKFNWISDEKGCYQTKGLIQDKISVKDYYAMTQSPKYATPTNSGFEDLEKKYWKSLSYQGCPICEYK